MAAGVTDRLWSAERSQHCWTEPLKEKNARCRVLKAIEAEVPAGKHVYVVLDNYAAHKYNPKPKVGDSQ